jgi:hypothetical protein
MIKIIFLPTLAFAEVTERNDEVAANWKKSLNDCFGKLYVKWQ